MKITLKQYLWIFPFAIGVSPLSSNVGGFNIKFPFFFLGLLLLFSKGNEFARLLKRTFYLSLNLQLFLFLMGLLGVFTGLFIGGSVYNVLLDYLAIVSFFILYKVKCRDEAELQTLYSYIYVLFIEITLYELFLLITGLSNVASVLDIRVINLVVCPFFLAMIYLKDKRILLSLLFLLICVFMTIRSAMRVNFFYVIFYVVQLIHLMFQVGGMRFYKKILLVVMISGMFMYIYPLAKDYIESDGSRSLHMINRTESMFTDEGDGETVRVNTNLLIFYEIDDFLLPHGLGWQNHTSNIMSKYRLKYGVMSTMDSCLFYCVYHFGIFVGLAIIIFIFYNGLKSLYLSIIYWGDATLLMCSLFFLTVIVMFALKSWIFVYSSFAISYGFLFAYANNLVNLYRNNLISDSHAKK